MPLRDHFHAPVSNTHRWDEVHGGWPMEIVRHLATILPPGYRAAPRVHLGPAFEVAIGSCELAERGADGAGGAATLVATKARHSDIMASNEGTTAPCRSAIICDRRFRTTGVDPVAHRNFNLYADLLNR